MILYCLGNNVRKMLHICNAGRMLFRHIFNLWLLIESMNTQTQIANYRIKSIFLACKLRHHLSHACLTDLQLLYSVSILGK